MCRWRSSPLSWKFLPTIAGLFTQDGQAALELDMRDMARLF
jgi:hypothetical protein